jgi:hypothetical protein
VGAGAPANTGVAGAIHRVRPFAGAPAPTVNVTRSRTLFSMQSPCAVGVGAGLPAITGAAGAIHRVA